MKQHKLAAAAQYIRTRNRQASLLKPYKSKTSFENRQGDFCCVRADIDQLKGPAVSARLAYDALMFAMANMEISVSEKLGQITVREEYGAFKDGVGNYRMRSWGSLAAPQEANCVLFTQFFEHLSSHGSSGGVPGYGVTVVDFVDRDDLHPYRSEESIRQDITSVFVISALRAPKRNPATGCVEEQLVVLVERAAFIRVHHTDLAIDEIVLDAVHEAATTSCEVIINSMREYIAAASVATPAAARE